MRSNVYLGKLASRLRLLIFDKLYHNEQTYFKCIINLYWYMYYSENLLFKHFRCYHFQPPYLAVVLGNRAI